MIICQIEVKSQPVTQKTYISCPGLLLYLQTNRGRVNLLKNKFSKLHAVLVIVAAFIGFMPPNLAAQPYPTKIVCI